MYRESYRYSIITTILECFKEHFEQGADAKNNLDARVKMGTKYILYIQRQRINIVMFKYQNQIIFRHIRERYLYYPLSTLDMLLRRCLKQNSEDLIF